MDEQQKQTILDLPKVVAVGISSPAATFLTSRFGVAGTLLGLALSAVILTVLADALKVYLARASAKAAKLPHTVAKLPVGSRSRRSRPDGRRGRLRAAFAGFSSLPPARVRWRPFLIGSVAAAGISFLVGLGVVTGLELGAGKSLSCWVWDECPAEASAGGTRTSATASTLPSIFGGSQGAGSVAAPEAQPPSPQQPVPPGTPGPPPQPEDGVPGSSEQPDPAQPGQRWSPGVVPEEGGEGQTGPLDPAEEEEDRRPSSPDAPPEEEGDRRPGSPGGSEGGEQRSPVNGSAESEQRSPADEKEGVRQQEEAQEDQPSSDAD